MVTSALTYVNLPVFLMQALFGMVKKKISHTSKKADTSKKNSFKFGNSKDLFKQKLNHTAWTDTFVLTCTGQLANCIQIEQTD